MALPITSLRVVSCALIALMTMPTFALAEPARQTIAVVPVTDGDGDERSREMAETVAGALRIATGHRIVDAKTSADIAAYHGMEAAVLSTRLAQAQEAIAEAKEHSFYFRQRDALSSLDRALGLLRQGGADAALSGPLSVDAQITRGIILKSRNEIDGARAAFAQALAVCPMLTLDAEGYAPSVIALFEEARQASLAAPTGGLRVTSKPPAAEVRINGLSAGVTPLLIENLPVGDYAVTIAADRYDAVSEDVTIAPGGQAKVRARLRWATSDGAPAKKAMAAAQVREGVRIAQLLRADRAVLVDAADGGALVVRMVDAQLAAGLKPIAIDDLSGDDRVTLMAELVRALARQTDADLARDPARQLDPVGMADPMVIARQKKPLHRQPLFWGAVGAVVAGAIAGGIVAAMSGGGGAHEGAVRVQFR